MRSLLVTGASGFVGSCVVRQLIAADRRVAVLLRKESDRRRLGERLDGVTIIDGDLADIGRSRSAIAAFAPDGVLAIGWQGVKNYDRNDPGQCDNVAWIVALCRLAAEIGCRHFIGLGSQAEYGPCAGAIDETTPTHPTTLYGAAKLAAALLLERIAAVTEMRFAWLRLFSSYGPDDDPSWLIPFIVLKLLKGEKPALTEGAQIWDYIHVADVAQAIIKTADSDATGIFNLGSGQAYSLRRIIEQVRDHIDPALPLGFGEIPYRPDQVMHLEANIARLKAATGWAPQISLADGLAETIDWYRASAAAG